MIIAGILGYKGKIQTANLVNSILSSFGKKTSVIDSKSLTELDPILIKKYIAELEKNNTDILVWKLDITDIEHQALQEISFDIIIYTDDTGNTHDTGNVDNRNETWQEKRKKLIRQVFNMVNEKGVLIINMDDINLLQILEGIESHIITYGFNSKASITTSSVGDSVFDSSFICCLQKTISARNGEIIEPQEYRLNIDSSRVDRHNILAAAAFAIVNGIDLNALPGVENFKTENEIN